MYIYDTVGSYFYKKALLPKRVIFLERDKTSVNFDWEETLMSAHLTPPPPPKSGGALKPPLLNLG
jgi:hypothetical protein